jgi:hypothetical protein
VGVLDEGCFRCASYPDNYGFIAINEDIDHNCITTKTKYLIAATNKKSKTCISKQLK